MCGNAYFAKNAAYFPSNSWLSFQRLCRVLWGTLFRGAGKQGPTRQEHQQLPQKRVIKQLLGTYSITQVKYHKQTRKLEKSIFSMLFYQC